jgi:hypothetical protein
LPKTRVHLFQEDDGTVPLLEWLDSLPSKAVAKCRVRIERLAAMGHELRRPEADLLRDGVYELRIGLQGQNYRMLYFFHGKHVAILSHGLVKEREVPPKEINKALERKRMFESNPTRHTYEEC